MVVLNVFLFNVKRDMTHWSRQRKRKSFSTQINPTPSKVNKLINNTKVESKMTPMHAQSIFIYIYIKIHGSLK